MTSDQLIAALLMLGGLLVALPLLLSGAGSSRREDEGRIREGTRRGL